METDTFTRFFISSLQYSLGTEDSSVHETLGHSCKLYLKLSWLMETDTFTSLFYFQYKKTLGHSWKLHLKLSCLMETDIFTSFFYFQSRSVLASSVHETLGHSYWYRVDASKVESMFLLNL